MSVHRLSLVPAPVPHAAATDHPGSPKRAVRVAIATRDGRAVNAHFGSAKRFVVYEVSATSSRFIESLTFESVSNESGEHSRVGDDRNGEKISALSAVDLLLVQAIGGPVAARVIRAGIHPLKFANGEPIGALIQQIQTMLCGDAPPWLRRVLNQGQARSMDFLDDND